MDYFYSVYLNFIGSLALLALATGNINQKLVRWGLSYAFFLAPTRQPPDL